MLDTYRKVKEDFSLMISDWYSSLKAPAYRDTFLPVKTFCLFIGYPRSGHSLVGSLLDAHQHIVIANELDVLRHFSRGMKKDQIFYLLLRNSERYAYRGRIQTGYNYDVPGQWQGKVSELRVIGDKKGGMTTQRIGRNYNLLDLIPGAVGVPVKYVHVVRNPFDNITTMALRTHSTLEAETEHYFSLCRINQNIKDRVGKENILEMRHEDIIQDPGKVLRRLTDFLEVSPSEDYIKSCSAIVSRKQSLTRKKADWPEALIRTVHGRIGDYDFLEHYTYDS
jgi:hypothetical protein